MLGIASKSATGRGPGHASKSPNTYLLGSDRADLIPQIGLRPADAHRVDINHTKI